MARVLSDLRKGLVCIVIESLLAVTAINSFAMSYVPWDATQQQQQGYSYIRLSCMYDLTYSCSLSAEEKGELEVEADGLGRFPGCISMEHFDGAFKIPTLTDNTSDRRTNLNIEKRQCTQANFS